MTGRALHFGHCWSPTRIFSPHPALQGTPTPAPQSQVPQSAGIVTCAPYSPWRAPPVLQLPQAWEDKASGWVLFCLWVVAGLRLEWGPLAQK